MLDREKVLEARNKYLAVLELASPVELAYLLAGMADAMQMMLSMPSTATTVPHHKALDRLMTAVAYDIGGDPSKRQHALSHASLGLERLERYQD